MRSSPNPAVRLAAVATATPPYTADQQEAEAFFLRHYGPRLSPLSLRLLRKFLAHPSIRQRRFALSHPDCLVAEDPDQRIERFTRWALDLSERAGREALERAGLAPADISALVVNTCTGYLCPGLSSYLLERLNLPRQIRAYDLVGGGCGGAVPNFQAAQEYLLARARAPPSASRWRSAAPPSTWRTTSACCSPTPCSATAPRPRSSGPGPGAWNSWPPAASMRPEDREAIRYVHKHGQLYNQLSRDLPSIVDQAVAQAVRHVLEPRGLTVADVAHWALHGGGDKVLAAVARELDIPPDKLLPTRDILARYGNMSSPSVLFTLKEILNNGLRPADWVLLASFGAGLSAHALLLKST